MQHPICSLLTEFYRCEDLDAKFSVIENLSPASGFFRLDDGTVCFGQLSGKQPGSRASELMLPVALPQMDAGKIKLTFDPMAAVDNLRLEKYERGQLQSKKSLVRQIYYLVRPLMPVTISKHLQRVSLRGWDNIPFPYWPVDRSVDRIHEWLLRLVMETQGVNEIPFVWFWPEGHSSCACMTHDVETSTGRDFCGQLMDIDDGFGIKSSFQVVPEQRYEVDGAFLDSIRKRGFEVNVHDLNHDGRLFFMAYEGFLERVEKINRYGREFGARGFRSAVLYRRQEWMKELEFAYDMSVPSVGHLEPKRGGCCTLMPYYTGDLLEIPVTTTQDYSLFHILGEYSTGLWERQLAAICSAHGMATFIVHPDYVIEARAQQTYRRLLGHLAELRKDKHVWIARPGDICDWWRQRAGMQLVKDGDTWRVE